MNNRKVANYILDRSYPDWITRLWERLVPESQLNSVSTDCRSQYSREENQALSSYIKALSVVFTIIWLTTYKTDGSAGILNQTIYLRIYYQFYLIFLVILSFKGLIQTFPNALNRTILLLSFFQVCLFQGFITAYSDQSTLIFVMVVNILATALSNSSFFKLFFYLTLSNGVYFYFSQDLPRMSNQIEQNFVLCVMLFQSALLIIPCTYHYQKIKTFVELYNKDIALRKNFDLLLKTSEATSTFLSQNHKDRINYATSILNLDYADAFGDVTQTIRHDQVVVLYIDIRSFTSTMRISKHVEETIKIMMSLSAEKIDNFWGNASDKGDLLLAYFDEISVEVQINLSLYSAFILNEVTTQTNSKSNVKIRRYPVLTLASCSTGNVASTRKRLIDAKGDAANLAARIDELTKSQQLKSIIDSEDIVLDTNFYQKMKEIHPEIEITQICLVDLDLKIRDFSEFDYIYIIHNSDHNNAYFKTQLKTEVEFILRDKKTHLSNYFKHLKRGITKYE